MRLPKSFYERPLTPKEAQFATDNINIVWWYLDQQGLDRAEWFDVVIFRYLISVKRWFALPDLQKVKFVTVACNAMRSAIGNARRKSAKEPQTVSLYEPIPGTEDLLYIQNENAKRSKFILGLNPDNVILLSGTPTGGKYEKLWSQCRLLGWNISKELFWKQYIETEWVEEDGFWRQKITGYKNVDRLKKKLAEHGAVFTAKFKVTEAKSVPSLCSTFCLRTFIDLFFLTYG